MNGPGLSLLTSELIPVEPRTVHPSSPLRQLASSAFQSGFYRAFAAGRSAHRAAAARQNIYRAGEVSEGVIFICTGWAVRFVQLPNGKRQILSVALPGDLIGAASILERQFSFSVQSVTAVRYCVLPHEEVRARIAGDPALFDAWLGLAAAELRDADRRLVDLGQRSAEERIAALFVHVMARCKERDDVRDGKFPFPLSQQQIADCTGLTPVHTCRVLAALRKRGVCDARSGTVTVLDLPELRRIAAAR